MSNIAIKLKPTAERIVKKGHPWIFESSIEKGPNTDAETGSLCVIFDRNSNQPFCFGLWDAGEIIRIRVFYWGRQLKLNLSFWKEQLEKAFSVRKPLIDKGVNGYRAIHGENDSFPGLILDVYASHGVLKIYSRIWKSFLEELLLLMQEVFHLQNIVIRFSRNINENHPYPFQEGDVFGLPLENEQVVFEEYGVQFYANLVSGHKTGFFLDQRPNRLWVQEHSAGKTVLDVFSYVGSFGVHALKGGAKTVTSVDISAPAMEMARKQIALNHLDVKRWYPIVTDAFTEINQMLKENQSFDIVIIDPPSLAKKEEEKPIALKQYENLTRSGKSLVKKNGFLILGSCSSRISPEELREIHQRVLGKDGRDWQLVRETFHDVDHPYTFPESLYLKTFIYKKRT